MIFLPSCDLRERTPWTTTMSPELTQEQKDTVQAIYEAGQN